MPDARIVFLGDSITQAWGQLRAEVFQQHGFVCRGVGGETTRQTRLRFPYAIEGAGALGLHLLCGINDLAENEGPVSDEEIQTNIAAMIADAQRSGMKVWLGSIMPSGPFAWRPHIDPRSRIAALNAWLRAHADEHACNFLNYHAVLATAEGTLQPAYTFDGVHLTEEGYLAIEPMMLAAFGLPCTA